VSERLQIVPVELSEANAFVTLHHRHHRPAVGHRFSLAAALGGEIVGVAIVGRPGGNTLCGYSFDGHVTYLCELHATSRDAAIRSLLGSEIEGDTNG